MSASCNCSDDAIFDPYLLYANQPPKSGSTHPIIRPVLELAMDSGIHEHPYRKYPIKELEREYYVFCGGGMQ